MRALRQRIAEFENEREAALAAEADAPRKKRKRKRKKQKRKTAPVANHALFVPLLTAWGAALGGLAVFVLPPATIIQIAMTTGLAGLGNLAILAIAGAAALIGGVLLFLIGNVVKGRTQTEDDPVEAKTQPADLDPIDPVAELGSESLDAPIEQEPFTAGDNPGEEESTEDDALDLLEDQVCEPSDEPTLGELSERGYDLDEPEPKVSDSSRPAFTLRDFRAALSNTCESMADAPPATEGVPREMDLKEFGELEGRDAVWVEEEKPDTTVDDSKDEKASEPDIAADTVPLAARVSPDATSAIEKLRKTPPSDLSLVQMVERFAAALHEYQEADSARPGSRRIPQRDAALAEALRALTVLTEGDMALPDAKDDDHAEALRDTTRELRDALAKLQSLRGAA